MGWYYDHLGLNFSHHPPQFPLCSARHMGGKRKKKISERGVYYEAAFKVLDDRSSQSLQVLLISQVQMKSGSPGNIILAKMLVITGRR